MADLREKGSWEAQASQLPHKMSLLGALSYCHCEESFPTVIASSVSDEAIWWRSNETATPSARNDGVEGAMTPPLCHCEER